jgi:hypothetical protein
LINNNNELRKMRGIVRIISSMALILKFKIGLQPDTTTPRRRQQRAATSGVKRRISQYGGESCQCDAAYEAIFPHVDREGLWLTDRAAIWIENICTPEHLFRYQAACGRVHVPNDRLCRFEMIFLPRCKELKFI